MRAKKFVILWNCGKKMAARLKEDYHNRIKPKLFSDFAYKSVMQVPKIEKVVLNIGMGEAHSNAKALETAINELTLIAGQKPVTTKAKKSIAGFKLREGMIVGTMVTLRGAKMYEFLDRVLNFAIPRVRDFNGLSVKSFDRQGNYNFSIKEQIIFPEIEFDKVDIVQGLNVSVSTTAKTKQEAYALLKEFNFPFRDKIKD